MPTAPVDLIPSVNRACPGWCVLIHGGVAGEEDWLHESGSVPMGNGIDAQLCMSIAPDGSSSDGPYLIAGDCEYSLAEARALALSLIALTDSADASRAAV